jgi:hypothetical protein
MFQEMERVVALLFIMWKVLQWIFCLSVVVILMHILRGGPFETKWRGTFVYGEPKPSNRHHMWTLLRRIKPRSQEPWLMVGDFNEAMWQGEHSSRSRRSERLMSNFREVLSECDLHDLGFIGTPWTYDNHRKGDNNVRVRLDRAVACPAWRDCYADTTVQHLTSPASDHCPVLVQLEQEVRVPRRQPKRQYEIFWEREYELAEQVSNAWAEAGEKQDLGDIMHSLNRVMTTLQTCSRK